MVGWNDFCMQWPLVITSLLVAISMIWQLSHQTPPDRTAVYIYPVSPTLFSMFIAVPSVYPAYDSIAGSQNIEASTRYILY